MTKEDSDEIESMELHPEGNDRDCAVSEQEAVTNQPAQVSRVEGGTNPLLGGDLSGSKFVNVEEFARTATNEQWGALLANIKRTNPEGWRRLNEICGTSHSSSLSGRSSGVSP